MPESLPSNAWPWLIGFPIFALFGWRALSRYRNLHSPLSKYFAISGFAAATAFFFWSVPFLFTRNETILIVVNIIGDGFLYFMLALQAVIVHYLTLKQKIPEIAVIIPVILWAFAGWVTHVVGYLVNGVSVINNVVEYQLPFLADIFQIVLLVNVLLLGVTLLIKIKEQTDTRGRVGLLGVGILYVLSGLAGAANVILSGNSNEASISFGLYAGGFLLFIVILLLARTSKSRGDKSINQA